MLYPANTCNGCPFVAGELAVEAIQQFVEQLHHRGIAAGGGIKHHFDHGFNVPIHCSFRMRLGEILTVPHARGDEPGIPPPLRAPLSVPRARRDDRRAVDESLCLTHQPEYAFRLAL